MPRLAQRLVLRHDINFESEVAPHPRRQGASFPVRQVWDPFREAAAEAAAICVGLFRLTCLSDS